MKHSLKGAGHTVLKEGLVTSAVVLRFVEPHPRCPSLRKGGVEGGRLAELMLGLSELRRVCLQQHLTLETVKVGTFHFGQRVEVATTAQKSKCLLGVARDHGKADVLFDLSVQHLWV